MNLGAAPPVTPPCVGQHQLFDSLYEDDAALALQVCAACPLRDNWCADLLEVVREEATPSGGTYSGPQGTWAGEHIVPKRDDPPPPPTKPDKQRDAAEAKRLCNERRETSRREQRLCLDCGSPAAANRRLCTRCQQRRNDYQRNRTRKGKAA
jgi:hypothetical protein